ncbi:hypothetical protein KP509_03G020800 [Ceratopteris richardii]|uniref:Uncharacterized protein n=2 Tax=Ceratopteris richardii TaxID=49495 RepID=A0A8T2UXY2_CERRI|nr:hypothetical protein KP509_03G020800 [Ceratopteris richardii]
MAKEILQTNDIVFASRARFAAAVQMYFNCADMVFAPYGPMWKFMRQLCATELFNAKRLSSFRNVREEESRDISRAVLEIGNKGNAPVKLRAMLFAASNNITCRMCMGKKFGEISSIDKGSEGERPDLLSLVEELMRLLGVFYIGDFIPWLWWLDLYGYLRQMKATSRKARCFMQEIIDHRRQELNGRAAQHSGPEDMLDVMIAAADDPKAEFRISDENIMGLILDLFSGGSDTSSVTVEWALADLMNNQEAMVKLQAELDAVVGKSRLVTESDVINLPYLSCVLKESMRLHPSVPLLLPHESVEACQIGGYRIPAKTRANVNTWAIGRDPSVWERPLEFWPERFDGNNLDLRGKQFELLPFGSGRRGCPGWSLGVLNVQIMLATLVQGFTWSVCSPSSPPQATQQPIDMSERFGTNVHMDKPLTVYATPRLPLSLY